MATPDEKKTNQIINNMPSLIIKPRTTQNSKKTKEEVSTKINPAKLNIRIQTVKALKSGSIIIKCAQKTDLETLKKICREKLTQKCEIQETTLRKPRIKIIGLNQKLNKEELEQTIRAQNPFINEEDILNITYINPKKQLQFT